MDDRQQTESFRVVKKRQAQRAIRRFLLQGHVFYKGNEVRTMRELVELFEATEIENQRTFLDCRAQQRLDVDKQIQNASFPTRWPETPIEFRKNLAITMYNPSFTTPDRLEQILRFFRDQSIVVLNATSKGMRTAPRGKVK